MYLSDILKVNALLYATLNTNTPLESLSVIAADATYHKSQREMKRGEEGRLEET